MLLGNLGTVPQQLYRIADRLAGVDLGKAPDLWFRVTKEVRDDAVQAIRLPQDDSHQVGLNGFRRSVGLKHLYRPAHRAERVAYLVSQPRSHAADRRQTVLTLNALFHRANLCQVLERNDQTRSLVVLGDQRRDVVTDMYRKAFGGDEVGFKSRWLIRFFRFERDLDRLFYISEEGKDRFP